MGERRCYRCGTDIDALERVGRRDTCLSCGAELHCCRNCEFYDPGRHNDCREPQAERQVDKERGNFCEYFSVRSAGAADVGARTSGDARAKLEGLFRKKEGL